MEEFIEKIENQQCRTCYNSTKGLKRLTNQTKCLSGSQQLQKSYAELLKEVSNINVMEDLYAEQMPQLICEVCARRLKAAHVFIQQTWEVNERLKAIAGQVEANKDLKCLQEAPVDILPIADIKAEKHEDEEMDFLGQFEPECFVELKEEKSDSIILKDDFKVDMLDLKKADQNAIEILTLPECQSSDITDPRKTNPLDNKIPKSNDFSLDEDNNNFSDADSDWKDDNDIEEIQNTQPKKKKSSPKSRKSSNNADDDIAVPCAECNKIFTNAKALVRHQRNTHVPEEQKCTCPLCGRRFSRSCNMYKHMRTFHGPDSVPLIRKPSNKERSFQCDKCEKNYTKKSHLNLHIKEKHNPENSNLETDKSEQQPTDATEIKPQDGNEPKKDKPKKRYEVRSLCSICGSSFASRTHLVVHMRRHTGERPFKCDLCERAYPRLSELVCHRRIHTGEKPFKCKICDKAFRVWSKMSNHMRSHTDIRPYKCSQCERSFKYSKDLNIHFRIHTGERPYKCNVCGSTFTQSNTLKAHRSKLGHMDDMVGVTVPSKDNMVHNYGIPIPTQITHI
ncbi:uncharacterized protein ACRADG_013230 [Cochliomyia hominivorax]